jgi:iron-sulfur cluster assembly protein
MMFFYNFARSAKRPIIMSEVNNALRQAPVSLTSGARQELERVRQEQNIPAEYGLRVGVKGGGCSGFSYILGFDVQKDNDEAYELDGLKILMERAHGIYLLGMEIDWEDGLNNRGFSFNNPNATDTCGCGTSFSA